MIRYGGAGCLSDGRSIDQQDAFEVAVARQLGARMRLDDDLCAAMWSALVNQEWRHVDGDTAVYTFRAAGDLVAAVRGAGCYLDWYCSGPYATVRADIAEALAREGWSSGQADFMALPAVCGV